MTRRSPRIKESILLRDKIRRGEVKCLCGCGEAIKDIGQPINMTTNPRFIHGHASRIAGFGRVVRGSPEHNAYMNIISRCGPNCAEKSKKHYFLKGVKVLFKDFAEFYNEVGERPSPEHSIDRIDGDGNYEPGNVRWATRNQQARNRSNVKLTEKDAEDIRRLLRSGISGPALARAYGVSNGTIYFIKSNKHWA